MKCKCCNGTGIDPRSPITYPHADKCWINEFAIRTGEFRNPMKGEWFLSGANPMAYLAPNDLSSPYHILELVVN